jgi:hypothetical protein
MAGVKRKQCLRPSAKEGLPKVKIYTRYFLKSLPKAGKSQILSALKLIGKFYKICKKPKIILQKFYIQFVEFNSSSQFYL